MAGASLRDRAMRHLERARVGVGRIGAMLLGHWRRSLQLRVVALTLALTTAVVAIIGYILMTQIRDELLGAKQRAAIGQTNDGVHYVERELARAGSGGQSAVADTMRAAVLALRQDGTAAGQFYLVAVSRTSDGRVARALSSVEPHLSAYSLPRDLQARVRDGNVTLQYATMDLEHEDQQVMVIGSPVPGDRPEHELYYIYPLTNEIDIMDFVERTVVIAALAFMVLIPGVGLLVSRLVVLPVRQARRTAQRLAEGDLQQRMDVRGEDDIARLGTSFNEMAASLSNQIIRLESLSQLQQRFSSDVSHELRTPLTTVRMAADLLYDYREDFPEAAARSAELLQAELNRFEELLEDLLEISRYDAGGLVLDAVSTDVEELVTGVVDAYQPLAEQQGCQLLVRFAGRIGEVEISPRRIERVLRNLIANALEHGADAPVEINVARDHAVVTFTVRDYGVGINQAAADRLFDRFWRADPSRVRKLGGTGLGMAISLEDVRLHSGWLQVWGAPARGTCFRMTLPVRAGGVVTHSTLPLIPDGEEAVAVGGVPALLTLPAVLSIEGSSEPGSPSEGSGPHHVGEG